jgi:hypothetical protein
MRPSDKRRTLWRDMTKLCRAGYGLRFWYMRLVVVLVATQACLATVCVSCRRDVRYSDSCSDNRSLHPALDFRDRQT